MITASSVTPAIVFTMGLFRLLAILFVAWLIYALIKRYVAQKQIRTRKKTPKNRSVEKMVRCQTCQLHIPEQEAICKDGRYYCSQAHLEADSQNKPD